MFNGTNFVDSESSTAPVTRPKVEAHCCDSERTAALHFSRSDEPSPISVMSWLQGLGICGILLLFIVKVNKSKPPKANCVMRPPVDSVAKTPNRQQL